MRFAAALLTIACSTAWAAGPCSKGPKDFLLLDATPQAKDAGVDYPKELSAAFHKDPAALGRLFDVTPHLDGSGAQTHAEVLWIVLQCWGDAPFAAALKKTPKGICAGVLKQLDYATDESGGYRRAYPNTEALKKRCL